MSSWQSAMEHRRILAEFMLEALHRDRNVPERSLYWAMNHATVSALVDGDTYFVQRDIVDLIEDAISTMPEDASVEPECLLSQRGFVWLEKPTASVQSKVGPYQVTANMHAMSWYVLPEPRSTEFVVQIYGDTGDMPCWPMFVGTYVLGEPVGEYEPNEVYRGDPEDTHFANGGPNEVRLGKDAFNTVVAFFLFVQQKIVEVAPPKLSRQQQRAMSRGKIPDETPLVVSLRRKDRKPSKTGEGAKLTMRVPTRPHWQRYHVGKDREEVVWKLKDLYWRGPEDAPVKPIVDRIFDVKQ